MRSFTGRDILSLKEFERQEFFRVFEIAERMEPIARNRRNSDLLKDKTLVTAFYQPSHPHAPGARGRHAPPGRARHRLLAMPR